MRSRTVSTPLLDYELCRTLSHIRQFVRAIGDLPWSNMYMVASNLLRPFADRPNDFVYIKNRTSVLSAQHDLFLLSLPSSSQSSKPASSPRPFVIHSYSETCTMGGIVTGGPFQYYRYTPSIPAASAFVVLFAVTTGLHTYQLARTRTWILLPLVLGGYCTLLPSWFDLS